MTISSTTLVVTTTLDQNNGNLSDGLSLREAILIANANPDTAYTIQLQGGLTYNLTLNGTREDKSQKGDLDLLPRNQPVCIEAFGAGQATINGATLTERDRVLDVKGAHLIIDGVVITGGYSSGIWGGGLRVVGGRLELYNSGIIDNYADNDGGGLFANKSEVYIYRSLIKGNVTGGSSSDGGGISNTTSIMTIVNSTLSENEVGFGGGSAGGAIHNFGGVLPGQTSYLVVLNSTLNNNRGRGSAISNDSNASSLVVNTTISGNTGTSVYIETGTHEFINTTITQNSQQSGNNRAAGIRHRDTKGGTVTLRNTIVSDNINASGNAWGSNLEGAFIGDGNNLIGDLLGATGTIGAGTDIIAANPQLGPLQDNGGPTRTHAPLPDSPAIDGGNDAFLPNDILDLDGDGNTAEKLPLDQRGLDFNRVAGLRVDIGAVETNTPLPPVLLPEFTIAATEAVLPEGNETGAVLTFTVTRSVNLSEVNTVDWSVSGLDVNELDFIGAVLPSGTLTFNPGEETQVISVNIQGDLEVEADENFTVTLSDASNNGVITTAAATGTILNDDTSSTITFTGTTSSTITFTGTSGKDTLNGTTGSDILIGLAGNDTYIVNHVGDVVVENPNEGTDTVKASISYTLLDNVENLTLTRAANLNGTGNSLNNKIVGNMGNNILNGGPGADTLTGKAGADIFVLRFGESQLGTIDRITDFAIDVDKIDLLTQGGARLTPATFTRAADSETTKVSSIINNIFADADGAMAGNQPLEINSAVLVKVNNANTTYLIVNDETPGFQSASDLVINLTGLTGAFPALGTIHVNTLFV
ncbi:MAG: choice-of-anchor Q domain-containing protein [Cyanobacteriota bacterium]|nr:choice-of-anchor Q domain-containing protein [Cyanobacteriota bacterium]